MRLKKTGFVMHPNRPERMVVLTEGGIVGGKQIYGVFATEADARSDRADSLALQIVGEDSLTETQKIDAYANSCRLGT